MDPQLRMLLEVTYEAIVDSGKYTHQYLILKQHLSKREEIIAIWFIFIYKVNLIEQNLIENVILKFVDGKLKILPSGSFLFTKLI